MQTLLSLLLILLPAVGCGRGDRVGVTVATAASLADPAALLDTLDRRGAAARGVTIVPGATNILARQIREGAPFDILLSADPTITAALVREGHLDGRSVVEIGRNRLVVAATSLPDTLYSSFDFLLRQRRIAVASEGVPLRTYTEQAFRRAGVWDRLGPRLVYGADARHVAEMVRNGDADVGILYATDAHLRKLGSLYDIPTSLHDPIRLDAAATPEGARRPEVREVMALLAGERFREEMKRRGFE